MIVYIVLVKTKVEGGLIHAAWIDSVHITRKRAEKGPKRYPNESDYYQTLPEHWEIVEEDVKMGDCFRVLADLCKTGKCPGNCDPN